MEVKVVSAVLCNHSSSTPAGGIPQRSPRKRLGDAVNEVRIFLQTGWRPTNSVEDRRQNWKRRNTNRISSVSVWYPWSPAITSPTSGVVRQNYYDHDWKLTLIRQHNTNICLIARFQNNLQVSGYNNVKPSWILLVTVVVVTIGNYKKYKAPLKSRPPAYQHWWAFSTLFAVQTTVSKLWRKPKKKTDKLRKSGKAPILRKRQSETCCNYTVISPITTFCKFLVPVCNYRHSYVWWIDIICSSLCPALNRRGH